MVCSAFLHTAAFNSPAIYPTPTNAAVRASCVLAHPRGEPYSALPNTAGGGEAAALCALPASRAARRRAVIPFWLSVPIYALPISRLWYSRRFAGKTEIADIEKAAAHAERGAGAKLCVPSRGVRFWFALLFCTRRLSIPRNISRPDKRRRPNEQLSHTARTRARRFAARAIGRLRRPLLLPPAAFAGRAPLQTKKLPQPVLQQPFSVRKALNKSRHASCLHIFRRFARKLLEIHQVFLRHFHAILGAASA